MQSMKAKDATVTITLAILAVAGGAWIGYADSRSDDVFITLGLLMGFSFLLGLVGPRRPWLWAPLVAIWVPVLDSVLPRVGLVPRRHPAESFTFLGAMAVIGLVMGVCFAGAFLGAGLVWSLRNLWPGATVAQR